MSHAERGSPEDKHEDGDGLFKKIGTARKADNLSKESGYTPEQIAGWTEGLLLENYKQHLRIKDRIEAEWRKIIGGNRAEQLALLCERGQMERVAGGVLSVVPRLTLFSEINALLDEERDNINTSFASPDRYVQNAILITEMQREMEHRNMDFNDMEGLEAKEADHLQKLKNRFGKKE